MSDSDDDDGFMGSGEASERKRPKTATDLIIDQALQEEQARKKAKKEGRPDPEAKKPKDGKTLSEIEAEEGGPIKESLVGMAQTKRAQNRKADGKELPDSTEVPPDVHKYEEDTQVTEEDGVKFTGFNLAEERETGFFDDEGNYVERKVADPTTKDMWMNSEEAKVVSDEVRKKIEARQKEQEEAEAAAKRAAPLTDRQIATLKMELAEHMQAGETLTRALKRHAGSSAAPGQRAMGKRKKQRLQQQQQAGDAPGKSSGGGASNVFTRMTEIADQLLAEGEVDIYTETKEDFERFGAMWLPKKTPSAAPAAVSAAAAAHAGAPPAAAAGKAGAADDEDDDMFAEDDDDAGAESKKAAAAPAAVEDTVRATQQAAAGTQQEAAQPAQPAQAVGADDGVDYASWPVKELKRFLQERGVDASSFVEKNDMVVKVKQLAAAGPVTAGHASAPAFPVPVGYAFDPSSGYYHNAEVGMYHDASSGWYYKDGTWYSLDASGQFVPHAG